MRNSLFMLLKSRYLSYGALLTLLFMISCRQQMESKLGIHMQKYRFPVLTGKYLGQDLPGSEPVLFAPGIVSDGMKNRDMALMPDGSEMYFSATLGDYTTILFSRQADGVWTKPEVAPFATDPEFVNIEPAISPDGKKLLFASNRPTSDTLKKAVFNIWVMNRQRDGWDEPQSIPGYVNTESDEFFPSLTNDGTLYFLTLTL